MDFGRTLNIQFQIIALGLLCSDEDTRMAKESSSRGYQNTVLRTGSGSHQSLLERKRFKTHPEGGELSAGETPEHS